MNEIRKLALVGVLAALAGPAAAVTLDQYSSIYVFGDSLSDPGNLPAGAAPSSPPYYSDGSGFLPGGAGVQFSDAPVWAERVGVTGNFAFGGAQAAPEAGGPPDLAEQIALFDGYSVTVGGAAGGASDLAVIWLGANDLFGAIEAAVPLALGGDLAGAIGVVTGAAASAAAAIGDGIEALAGRGFESFAVFNLPALEETPLFNLFQPGGALLAEAGTDAFNGALLAEIASLAAYDVTFIDIAAVFEDLLANPGAFGIENTTFPCVLPPSDGLAGSVCENPSAYAFFDAVHPTGTVHAAVADVFHQAVAPIPLPAGLPLLALGLGGLAIMRRRRVAV